MSTRVNADQMRLAAEWLDCNEGTDGESDACHAVAEWLRAQAKQREDASLYRAVAKQSGQPITRVRQVLRKRNEQSA